MSWKCESFHNEHTVIRIPRMQGLPARLPGSIVISS